MYNMTKLSITAYVGICEVLTLNKPITAATDSILNIYSKTVLRREVK